MHPRTIHKPPDAAAIRADSSRRPLLCPNCNERLVIFTETWIS